MLFALEQVYVCTCITRDIAHKFAAEHETVQEQTGRAQELIFASPGFHDEQLMTHTGFHSMTTHDVGSPIPNEIPTLDDLMNDPLFKELDHTMQFLIHGMIDTWHV